MKIKNPRFESKNPNCQFSIILGNGLIRELPPNFLRVVVVGVVGVVVVGFLFLWVIRSNLILFNYCAYSFSSFAKRMSDRVEILVSS